MTLRKKLFGLFDQQIPDSWLEMEKKALFSGIPEESSETSHSERKSSSKEKKSNCHVIQGSFNVPFFKLADPRNSQKFIYKNSLILFLNSAPKKDQEIFEIAKLFSRSTYNQLELWGNALILFKDLLATRKKTSLKEIQLLNHLIHQLSLKIKNFVAMKNIERDIKSEALKNVKLYDEIENLQKQESKPAFKLEPQQTLRKKVMDHQSSNQKMLENQKKKNELLLWSRNLSHDWYRDLEKDKDKPSSLLSRFL